MGRTRRVMSAVLLATGVVLVFIGLSRAMGFSPTAIGISVVAIAALLYAGGAWFGGAPTAVAPAGAAIVIVFDRSLKVVAGRDPGTSLLLQFPLPLRSEIEMRCRLALSGEHTHFECEHAGARLAFDIGPVQSIHGVTVYGVLITGSGAPAPQSTASPLPTVA